MKRTVVGLVEPVKIVGRRRIIETLGKFDTGAMRTSIDENLVSKIGVNPIGKVTTLSVHGKSVRPLVDLKLNIKGKTIKVRANVSDRSSRRYKILVGRDVIFQNFVIDISKSHQSPKLRDLNESMRNRK